MENVEALTTHQISGFLAGSEGIGFTGQNRSEIYSWTEALLVAQEYGSLGRKQRGAIRAYLSKMTGLSLPQITRLIRSYVKTGTVRAMPSGRCRFARKYSAQDVGLLAEVDRAHQRLSGPATCHILRREHAEFGKPEFANLAELSPSHLYNLRQSPIYRRQAAEFTLTKPSAVTIGERRRPDPKGRPGYLRVDTVHQGDWDGAKGVYHINAVDTVTQWQVVGCAEKISEAFLMPVLEAILHQFPFVILGFHSDNGSEYINHRVADMLNKLLVEFTKSRACRSQDNALVEGKNGATIRKLIGYGHIPAEHAGKLQKFYTARMNPYLNFHRPCGFATVSFDARGKRKRTYKLADYATPLQKLKSLPKAADYLKNGITFDYLDGLAGAMSDTEFARTMNAAKAQLLRLCKIESPLPPPCFL